jgi:aspartyl-tRNA(Asn)/glutamyl-tRNA(Gln) amidotransferase subunit A
VRLFRVGPRSVRRSSASSGLAYAIHRERLAAHGAEYDPIVRNRIEAARDVSAADYLTLIRNRAALLRAMDTQLSDLDGLVLPTTPTVAPKIAEVSGSFEAFIAKNTVGARNTNIVNFFNLCAISLPLPRAVGLPVGLMLVARSGQDRKLLRMAAAVERLFAT